MAGIDRLRDLIAASRKAVVFTGAGIGTEAGRPDRCNPGTFWGRHEPIRLNRDATPLDHLADLVLNAKIGPTLSAAVSGTESVGRKATRRQVLKTIAWAASGAFLLLTGRPQESLAATTYIPEDFGAVGDGKTDDAPALRKCFEAAERIVRDGGDAEIVFSNTYAVASTVSLKDFTGRLTLRGTSARSTFKAIGSADLICLHLKGGRLLGPPLSTDLKASQGVRSIRVGDLSGISPGQYIVLSQETGYEKDFQRYLNRVAEVAEGAISLELPLPNDIRGNYPTQIQLLDIKGSVTIENLGFDGSENSGNSTGLRAEFLHDPAISWVSSVAFDRQSAEGQSYLYCYQGDFSNLRDRQSGRIGSTNSIKFLMISNARISDVHVLDSKGFAIGLTHCSHCRMEDLSSFGAAGRGIKLFSASSNDIRRVRVVASGKTGLSISNGSSYNRFETVEAVQNSQAGLWLNGTANNFNTFKGVVSSGNGIDVQVGVTASLVDQGNVLLDVAHGAKKLAINPKTGTTVRYRP